MNDVEHRSTTDRNNRHVRRLRLAGVTAAAVAVAAFVAPSVPPFREASDRGGDVPQVSYEGSVGDTVQLETITVAGSSSPHTAYLSNGHGDGLQLCDGYELAGVPYGSCVSRDGRDSVPPDPEIIPATMPWPWFAENDDGSVRTITGAVTARVARVETWRIDGSRRRLTLHALGVEGLKAFGVTVLGGKPSVHRLVAYGKGGAVLQVVDGTVRAPEWIPAAADCKGPATSIPLPEMSATVAVYPAEARFVQDGSGTGTVCQRLTATLQGVRDGGRAAVMLLAPEVAHLEWRSGQQRTTVEPEPLVTGTIWRIAVVRSPTRLTDIDQLVALDAQGKELAVVKVSSLP